MDVTNLPLLVNTFVYFVIFVCGFAISIPLGVSRINSEGCLLYATLKPPGSSNYMYFLVFSNESNCEFPIFSGVIFCILYALGMAIYNSCTIYKSQKDPSIASKMCVIPFIMLNSLVTIIMLVASCMISVGFKEICDSMTKGKYEYFPSCIEAENQKLVIPITKKISSTGRFYTLINVSQTASWICTICWLILVLSGIIQFVLNRRLETRESAESDTGNRALIGPTKW
ncbi:transmembrane protein 179B-like [Saccostrea echinata]|uniref:transmembrane protein 179B-like n=1 Tax=Saccostrea echinata TaxID=191078 RepID=UPI002A8301CD|nr:transmembrane protein 179B-like [Saccostrea echinata]